MALSELSNTFFPICSFMVSLFIVVNFFHKENVKNSETKLYSLLIICGIIESSLYVILTFLVDFLYKSEYDFVFGIYNKLLGCMYLIWMSLLLFYIITIIYQDNEHLKKIVKKGLFVLNFILMVIIFILPIELYYDPVKHISNSFGPSLNFLFLLCFLYLMVMLVLILKNRKNDKISNKFLPCYILFILIGLSLIIRLIDPYFNVTSNVLSFVLLIMYFTIENPDIRMLEQVSLARDHAEKANAAKTDFLSSMSHEIRTPLNAIVGFSEAINDASTLEEAKNDAKDIIMASQNLLEIVNGILDISKIEANKMEIVNKDYNLKEECQSLVKLIKTRIGEKPIEFNFQLAQDIPDVLYGDKAKVKEILSNLLTNAVKYTDKGKIDFTVNCINRNNDCSLIMSVEDTGRGIKPERIEKLFNRFERLDEDRNTTIEGAGLGLAITKALVEMMGGKIVVQSVYGSGSKFTIYLKQRISNKKLNVNKEEKEDLLVFDNKKVLVVDDNDLNLKVAFRLLKKYGLSITCCSSGVECLEKINNGEKYDLILMDDMMPKMSGTETLHLLKDIPSFQTSVICLTANAIEGMKEKYIEEGFNDYLAKPIDKINLEKILRRYLNKKIERNHFEPLPDEIYTISDTAVMNLNEEIKKT